MTTAPPTNEDEGNVSVRMPTKLKLKLKAVAKKQDLTLSQFIRKHMTRVMKMDSSK